MKSAFSTFLNPRYWSYVMSCQLWKRPYNTANIQRRVTSFQRTQNIKVKSNKYFHGLVGGGMVDGWVGRWNAGSWIAFSHKKAGLWLCVGVSPIWLLNRFLSNVGFYEKGGIWCAIHDKCDKPAEGKYFWPGPSSIRCIIVLFIKQKKTVYTLKCFSLLLEIFLTQVVCVPMHIQHANNWGIKWVCSTFLQRRKNTV